MTFIARPSHVFKQYVRSTGRLDNTSYHMGMMALALEIITQIKVLEEMRYIASDLGREEAVSALQTLLKDCGIHDVAYEMYDRLAEWRKPKFSPLRPHDELSHVPLGISSFASESLEASRSGEPSSDDASPPEDLSRDSKPPASPPARRDPGETLLPTSLLAEGAFVEGREKPSE